MTGRLIIFSDGRHGLVGADGWVDEFDAIDPCTPELEGPHTIAGAFIDIEPETVTEVGE
jgi:hypothetical protein